MGERGKALCQSHQSHTCGNSRSYINLKKIRFLLEGEGVGGI